MLRYIIDRFEDSVAVCEDDQGSMVNIDKSKIPSIAREGDVIRRTILGYVIDVKETENRKAKIEKLAKDLWVD